METPVATWQSNPPEQLLKERFRISTGFHPGQHDIIEQLVQGKRLLVIQRTGWGKSLCYQMASLYYPHLTLVFSPLKALMRDQSQRCNDVYTIPAIRLSDGMLKTAARFLEKEFLPRFEKRGTEKRPIMGVQGAKPPDGVRGVPKKLFFPFRRLVTPCLTGGSCIAALTGRLSSPAGGEKTE
jgi:hypothetical protein